MTKRRPIKFRGLDYNNNWIYGDLVNGGIKETDDIFGEIIYVKDNTIGESTSHYDKINIETFEGDIIYYKGELFEIIYEDACFWAKNEKRKIEFHKILKEKYRIIGNIYLNEKYKNS